MTMSETILNDDFYVILGFFSEYWRVKTISGGAMVYLIVWESLHGYDGLVKAS